MRLSHLTRMLSLFVAYVSFPFLTIAQEPRFIILSEVRESGGLIPLADTLFFHLVDINSTVSVRFNTSVYAIDDKVVIDSERSRLVRKRMEDAQKLLGLIKSNLGKYTNSINTLSTQLMAGGGATVEVQFRESLRAHGELIEGIINFLNGVGATEALEQALSEPDPSYSKVIELLNATFVGLKDQVQELASNDSVFITVWCIQRSAGKEPVRIHMPNYDDLPSGNVNLVDKVTFSRTDEEEEYLAESKKFHEDVGKLVKDIGNGESELRKAFERLKDQFLHDLQDIRTLFGAQELQQALNDLMGEMANAATSTEIMSLKSDIETLRTTPIGLQDIFDLSDASEKLVGEIEKAGTSPQSLFEFLAANVNQLAQLKDRVRQTITPARLKDLGDLSEKTIAKIGANTEAVPEQVRSKLNEFLRVNLGNWKSRVSNLETLLKKYDSVKLFTDQFEQMKGADKIARKFSEIAVPDVGTVHLDQAPETRIEITRTNRSEDDEYTLYVRVSTKELSKKESEHSIMIKKFGWYSRWVGSLVFTKHEKESAFIPVTSVSWVLHHRYRTGNCLMGNVVDFGLGLNTIVFASEGRIEYGFGGVVSLFGDILQVGGGFNLQRDKDRAYGFIGASLFDLLKKTTGD